VSPFTSEDAERVARRHAKAKPRPKGKIPYAPARDASLTDVRDWLSDAAGLPLDVRVEEVHVYGSELEDPVAMVLSNKMRLRCPHRSMLTQPRTLQAWLASASDGIAQPLYLSPGEAGDFHTQLCRLGGPSVHSDPIADLHERLAAYVGLCTELVGSIVDMAHRFVTIEAIRQRPAFDRGVALGMTNGRPEVAPVLLVDQGDAQRYVRASEWVAYQRFVLGRKVDESGLVARMAEMGSERVDPQAWNADRSRKVHLVFYTLPEGL
jgi:hypothetical protein